MNAQTIFAVLAIIAFYAIARARQRRADAEAEADLFDSARLQREINALHKASEQLAECDRMLIDLRLCKPGELHRAFRMQWQSQTGGAHSIDFLADGDSQTARKLIDWTEARRAEINADIQARIVDLYARAQSLDFYSDYDAERGETYSEQNGAEGEGATL